MQVSIENHMKTLNYLFFAIIALISFSSCNDEPYQPKRKNAFLFYAASANNLESLISANVQSILTNYVPSDEKDIYIYFKKLGATSTLSRVIKIGGKVQLIKVKEYDETVSCATAETLDMVMRDVASSEYVSKITDVLLSSHGSSWLPTITVDNLLSREPYNPTNKARSVTEFSFGQDMLQETESINIDKIADIFEKYDLNSIIFDACNMCSIEVLYELRNCAKYILASPAEILGTGMCYPKMTPYFTSEITLETVRTMAEDTYQFYSKESAIMTVTDCSQLEALASVIKEITTRYGTEENNRLATPSSMIRYDFVNGVAKDYLQYLNNLLDIVEAPQDKILLKEVWDKVFPYCYHTETLFLGWPMEGACGVGGYIYRETEINSLFNPYYKTLDWGKLILGESL